MHRYAAQCLQSELMRTSKPSSERGVTKLGKNERRQEAEKDGRTSKKEQEASNSVSPQCLNMSCDKVDQITTKMSDPSVREKSNTQKNSCIKNFSSVRQSGVTQVEASGRWARRSPCRPCCHNFVSVLHLPLVVLDQSSTA